jgi:hypothetical protein
MVPLVVFQLYNSARTRVVLEHWQVPQLIPLLKWEFALGCLMPAAILLALCLLPPTGWTLLCGALIFLVTHAFYELVEETIHREVERANKVHGTEHFRRKKPGRLVSVNEELGQIAERDHEPGIWRILIWPGKEPFRPGLSRTRSVVLAVMLGSLVLALSASADAFLYEELHSTQKKQSQQERQDDQASEQASAEPSGEVIAASSAESAIDAGNDDCQFQPGDGAPRWAKADLYALYFGGRDLEATDPPGTDIGGCVGLAITPPGLEDRFVYVIGRDDGELRSVAVTSTEYGPAIFLAPAAQKVLELIEEGVMPVGGYPNEDVLRGDVAPILTPDGTVMLVRAEKHLPEDERYAAPYVELEPTAASAWVGAMREEETWLWPLAPRSIDGVPLYDLARDAAGHHIADTVTFHPETGAAERGPYSYEHPQPQIGLPELRDLASRALR